MPAALARLSEGAREEARDGFTAVLLQKAGSGTGEVRMPNDRLRFGDPAVVGPAVPGILALVEDEELAIELDVGENVEGARSKEALDVGRVCESAAERECLLVEWLELVGEVADAYVSHLEGVEVELGDVEVVDDDELLDRARAIASDIAVNAAPVSVAVTRQMLWRGLTFDHPMLSHRADSRAIQALGRAADAREGVSSFLEKRDPEWSLAPAGDTPEVFPFWEEPDFS